ncbi:hypothetical protein PT974_07014 [Cladobotryum mycophilum]|uniref:Uncharacterized protein n=1 Tax=Cladobotryum mycophilum TaxID=491253 RepID=A0ABR0SN43_9HYPO
MIHMTIVDYIESIPVENARLGRLVLNRRHPYQDYRDAQSINATSSKLTVKSYENFRKELGSASLITKFTEFVSASFNYEHKGTNDVSAVAVSINTLHNSGEWF